MRQWLLLVVNVFLFDEMVLVEVVHIVHFWIGLDMWEKGVFRVVGVYVCIVESHRGGQAGMDWINWDTKVLTGNEIVRDGNGF